MTDTTYKDAPVSTAVRPLESNEGAIVKPTSALEVTPPTVTGQNPAVAEKAGYPLENVKKETKANMDGIGNFVAAVTDTTYAKDKITPENVVLPSDAGVVKPTPELEKLQPTVTGQNPEVAAKAGYPVANVKEDAKAKMDGIDNFVAAVTDTTYVNDKASAKKDGVILSTD